MINKLDKQKVKDVFLSIGKYAITVIIVIASFFYGRFYENYSKPVDEEKVASVINRKDVNLAIDESNNLMIVDKQTGYYTVYQDSLGESIFRLYAKNIWAQHDNK